ncbi:thiolase family protein [Nocardia pseudovaccinii]|uniref:thiolase family protein n=1 Tax=Nocardia pseudovaccinii TaxID=189540 RepID=UPI0007A54D08|nr:thiolase family protein [Nocardia pseudovaccinii]
MQYNDVAIPLGQAWSSPFAKWQGALAETSSLDLAVAVTSRALADRGVDVTRFDGVVMGWTVPQQDLFFGAPTLAARLGAVGLTGPMVGQACATGVAALHAAAAAVMTGATRQLVVVTDRTSNGPTLSWPKPSGQGGAPVLSHWVLDSFARDPWAGESMLATAEAVAGENGITREELDDLTALRWEQYQTALAEDRRFQRRYQVPVDIERPKGAVTLESDEGTRSKERAAIGALPPAGPGAVHTYASQTHPADGCAGAVVTTTAEARSASSEGVVRILSSGFARAGRSRMPEAPVPAARAALDAAGLGIGEVHAIATHNPFAVNDVYFCRETGVKPEDMNVFGCSLVFGHPNGPTGLRSIAELIETLRLRGGGVGLFTGCAAGDTAAAMVVEVTDR